MKSEVQEFIFYTKHVVLTALIKRQKMYKNRRNQARSKTYGYGGAFDQLCVCEVLEYDQKAIFGNGIYLSISFNNILALFI